MFIVSIDLLDIKQKVPCQKNSGNKAVVISCDTFDDVMCFAISSRGAAISRGYIRHSYMFPGANRQPTAAVDRGTNLSFAL